MNLNLLSYLLFFPTMVALACWVAQTAHRHGEVWLMGIFGDAGFVKAVNNILLVGCYALNIGYVAFVVSEWGHVYDLQHLLAVLTQRFALIITTLCLLHYMNITVLLIWSRFERERHGQAPRDGTATQAP